MMKYGTVRPFTSRSSRKNLLQIPMLKKVSRHLWLIVLDSYSFAIVESVFSLAALESKLVAYIKDPAAIEQPFDTSSVPKISRAQAAQEVARTSIERARNSFFLKKET